MNEYERLKQNIRAFLKDYLTSRQMFSEPKLYGNRITAQYKCQDSLVYIDIVIGEYVSDLVLETYFGANNKYEGASLQTHLYNIPNDNMQSIKIIDTIKQIFPKFETIIKQAKEIMEEQ